MNHRSLRALQRVARAPLCAAALLLSPAASAEGDTRARAAEYFDAGAQAFDAGQYAVAAEAFLKAGGPQRDSKKLDPDGDGFACGFDPTPFQSGG